MRAEAWRSDAKMVYVVGNEDEWGIYKVAAITALPRKHPGIRDALEGYIFSKVEPMRDAIFSFLEKLYGSLNDGDVAAAVFCDLSYQLC